MATHSSVLAWRIPGTGEPGGLSSMGSHRVGQSKYCKYCKANTIKVNLKKENLAKVKSMYFYILKTKSRNKIM